MEGDGARAQRAVGARYLDELFHDHVVRGIVEVMCTKRSPQCAHAECVVRAVGVCVCTRACVIAPVRTCGAYCPGWVIRCACRHVDAYVHQHGDTRRYTHRYRNAHEIDMDSAHEREREGGRMDGGRETGA